MTVNDPNPHLPGTQPLSGRALSLPPGLVEEIALGMRTGEEIAPDYGFTQEQYAELAAWPLFQRMVERRRAELDRDGITLRAKLVWMTTDSVDDLYLLFKSPDTSVGQKLQIAQWFAKMADLEPKPSVAAQQQGTGFTININLSGNAPVHSVPVPPPVIDVDPEPPLALENPFAVAVSGA